MTRSRLLGHPLHQILIVFPLGLLGTSFLFDLAWLANGNEQLAIAAFWMIVAGVIGGGIASVAGVADWMSLRRGSAAWRMGALHGGGNVVVAALFAASWCLRRAGNTHPAPLAIALSGLGVLLIIVTGWLGSELAERVEETP